VRPGKPNDDPKSQPDHEDYDPFHLPMPTLKTGEQPQTLRDEARRTRRLL